MRRLEVTFEDGTAVHVLGDFDVAVAGVGVPPTVDNIGEGPPAGACDQPSLVELLVQGLHGRRVARARLVNHSPSEDQRRH